jgi:hypothetical protein
MQLILNLRASPKADVCTSLKQSVQYGLGYAPGECDGMEGLAVWRIFQVEVFWPTPEA